MSHKLYELKLRLLKGASISRLPTLKAVWLLVSTRAAFRMFFRPFGASATVILGTPGPSAPGALTRGTSAPCPSGSSSPRHGRGRCTSSSGPPMCPRRAGDLHSRGPGKSRRAKTAVALRSFWWLLYLYLYTVYICKTYAHAYMYAHIDHCVLLGVYTHVHIYLFSLMICVDIT